MMIKRILITPAFLIIGIYTNLPDKNHLGQLTVQQNEINHFMNDALFKGMMKEQMGQIASQKGVLLRIQDFGHVIEKDNNEANEELKKTMKNKNMFIPENLDDKYQKEINKLDKKTGNKFDYSFIKYIIENYEIDITQFSEMYSKVSDDDLKKWIENTMNLMGDHLQKAREIKENLVSD